MPVLYAVMETSVAPLGTRPAGFWIRAAALLVDFALFYAVYLSLERLAVRVWGVGLDEASLLQPAAARSTLAFTLLYTTVLHAWGGQTIGKLLVGARVVTGDGDPLPFGAALLRYFACYVSLLTLTLGFVIAGLRHDKRALHDLIAGSRGARAAPAAAVAAAASPPAARPAEAISAAPATPVEGARPPGETL
jgi:uncharacterized RDD family membrane protein YckC